MNHRYRNDHTVGRLHFPLPLLAALVLAFILAYSPLGASTSHAADSTSAMDLYAIYITNNPGESSSDDGDVEMGDAVLMKSGGEYLLMDTGNDFVSNSVSSYLQALGVQEMSVYISHLHQDHYKGIARIAREANISIPTIYLPASNIGTDFNSENGGDIYNQRAFILDAFPNARIVELSPDPDSVPQDATYAKEVTSSFRIGSVQAKVLGPVSNNKQSKFKNDQYGDASGHYLNNQSLTTMFTCGSVKYLTTGDIESKEEQPNYKSLTLEEDALAAKYGSKLRADILKMSHHGLNSSNSTAFIKAVQPKYAFAQNSGYTGAVKTSDGKTVARSFTPISKVNKYGLVYLVGNEKAALHIKVRDNNISLMKAPLNSSKTAVTDGKTFAGSSFTGWVDLCGNTQIASKDSYTGKNHYYMSKGKFKTGVCKISKKYYNFGKGTAALQGTYTKGKYSGWRYLDTAKKKSIYFKAPDSKGRAAAVIGFGKAKAADGKKYYFYFDKSKLGARYIPKKGDSNSKGKKWKLKKIGKYKYLFKKGSGAVFNYGAKKNAYMPFGKKLRAFNKKGRMIKGWAKVAGKKHYFDKKTGYRKK